jgi:putrescine transport system substrate-binding protein
LISSKSFRFFSVLIIFGAMYYLLIHKKENTEGNYVNVYDWYGMLNKEIIHTFEKETGIKVRYDVYDNNEVLEAKLLASNSGYDIVFPSASPYLAWQIQAGVYQKLNRKLLPNLKGIDQQIIQKMKNIDHEMIYSIPYYWGTIGFSFNVDIIKKILPDVDMHSLKDLLNPEILKIIAPYGISLLEEAVDIFPSVMIYLGINHHDISDENLIKSEKHLKLIRPYIKKFTSSQFINDLSMGNICFAHVWSGEAQQAIKEAKENNINLCYILPKEGAILWIDAIAIPKGAPHPNNAHQFINFLLRPEIAAKISELTLMPTSVLVAKKLLPLEIQNNHGIYPPQDMMKKLFINNPPSTMEELNYDRKRTRSWARVRLNQS